MAIDVIFFDECIKAKKAIKKSSRRFGFFGRQKQEHKSWILINEEMKEKRTIVGLEPSERGLKGEIFSHSTYFPEKLSSALFGEIRNELHISASFRNTKLDAVSKKVSSLFVLMTFLS